MLAPGDPAPWFEARSSIRPKLVFENLGGQYVVLTFLGSASFGPSKQLIDEIERERAALDVCNACFFSVSVDAEDEKLGRLSQKFPRIYHIWDFDGAISRLYGAAGADGKYLVHTLIIDPNLRVVAVILTGADISDHVRRISSILKSVPPTSALDGFAPILILPGVFEPQLCKALIDGHERFGGQEIGTIADEDGQSVRKNDYRVKRTKDWVITEQSLLSVLHDRVRRRVFPEIKKAFHFTATQIESFVVACYNAEEGGGYFRPHRDNTHRASAHRRFAVSVALDNDRYEGGGLNFPEYGARAYRAPTGGAIVFSCTLVHEVRPVTRGKRYACLPFVFDDEGARIRQANQQPAASRSQQLTLTPS